MDILEKTKKVTFDDFFDEAKGKSAAVNVTGSGDGQPRVKGQQMGGAKGMGKGMMGGNMGMGMGMAGKLRI